MPDMQGRNLASNLRGIGVEQNNVPEWKAHITGGAKGKLSTSIEALTLKSMMIRYRSAQTNLDFHNLPFNYSLLW